MCVLYNLKKNAKSWGKFKYIIYNTYKAKYDSVITHEEIEISRYDSIVADCTSFSDITVREFINA